MDMRATNFTLLFITLSLLPFLSFSQQKNNQLSIEFSTHQIRLDSLSNKVFRQTNYVFSFNSKNIIPSTKIFVDSKKISLNDLLSSVSQQLNIQYQIQDNYIILHRKIIDYVKKKNINASNVSNSSNVKENIDFATRSDSIKRILKEGTLIALLPDKYKTGYVNRSNNFKIFDSLIVPKKLAPTIIISQPSIKKENNFSYEKSNIKTKKENLLNNHFRIKNIFSPYASGGIDADETMYLNANINAGFRWLFGTIDWSTNFKKSMFLYGAGTSFSLGKNWLIQLSGLTGGRASNNYKLNFVTNPGDSVGPGPNDSTKNLVAKAFLSRMNLMMKKQINAHIQIEFGPILNLMNTKYYQDNSLTSIKSLFPNIANPDETYYVLKPPYTLSNNINSNATINKKTWIGFKIGLVYIFK